MMDRQRLLDNFYSITKGKGPCAFMGTCQYFKDGHPGCAIGCQPEFQEWSKDFCIEKKMEINELGAVYKVLERFPELKRILGVKTSGDRSFLSRLQSLHDDAQNWEGDNLEKTVVNEFCLDSSLLLPWRNDSES